MRTLSLVALWLLVTGLERAGTRIMSSAVDGTGGWRPAAHGPAEVRKRERWLDRDVYYYFREKGRES